MRIPASLVGSRWLIPLCVTAVPFGLAIRDTVRHTPRGDELDLTGEQTRARDARARAEREEAKARAEYEAEQRAREARLLQLFGKTPASLGSLFEGVTLGAPAESFQTEEARQRIYDAIQFHALEIAFLTDKNLDGIRIDISQSECDRLHSLLDAAWRPSSNDVWLDPATHQRAAFSADDCSLVFDRYLDAADWVALLPLHLDDTTFPFAYPGVGSGRGGARCYRDFAGIVRGVNITGDTDLDTQAKIRDALAARLNVQPVPSADDANVWLYNSKPPVRFDASGASRFSIQIGRPTWQ